MARDKIKVLFNKARIIITKTILGNPKKRNSYIRINSISTSSNNLNYYNNHRKRKTIKCKSPLGFWYTKTIYQGNNTNDKSSSTTKVIEFYKGDIKYDISYLTEYNGTKIGIETRPWNIGTDSCSMPDHQINALLRIIKNLIEESKGAEIQTSHHDFQNTLMTDLFGNPKGPRFQSDEEKIISHGFDPKISFRNRKEK